jgi:hypothetical protein
MAVVVYISESQASRRPVQSRSQRLFAIISELDGGNIMATGVLFLIIRPGVLYGRWRYLRNLKAGERPQYPKWMKLGASDGHVDKMNEWMWLLGPIAIVIGLVLILTA